MAERVFMRNFDRTDSHTLAAYQASGGYQAFRKAVEMGPEAVHAEVKKSNLRGLGGAGFPTGTKWGFVPKQRTGPAFLVVNADEGEPGTFKDRYLLERDPHALVEGMLIASYAIGCQTSFIYIRGEYVRPWRIFSDAVAEAEAAGLLGQNIMGTGFDHRIVVHRGAGAYICGEETGLLSSLEGKKGWPKIKPPFPAVKGAFGHPTVVNNVETISALPPIVSRGGAWFAGLGTPSQGGTRMFSVSGHVNRPGVYELPVTATMRELIYDHAGGIRDGRALKGVVPGGSSTVLLTAAEIDVTLDVDGLKQAGSFIGSAGVVVMDETTCIPEALYVLARFYAHESCGQCTPCRECTGWVFKIVGRILAGKGVAGDPDTIVDVAKRGAGTTICAFYDGAVAPYISYVEKFRSEFDYHIQHGACDVRPGRTVRVGAH